MRTGADKMPQSAISATGNALGESNDRFGVKRASWCR